MKSFKEIYEDIKKALEEDSDDNKQELPKARIYEPESGTTSISENK